MKNKERIVWVSIVLILLGVVAFRPGQVFALSETAEKYLKIFHEIVGIVQFDYVEPTAEDSLYKGAINGLVESLGDPHSRFLDQEEFSQLQEETRGSFGGLGMEVTFSDGAIIVISPIDDTPAMRAGILPQDRIIEIEGKATNSLSLMESIQLMRGKVGSSVSIKLLRQGEDKPIEMSLVRELIQLNYVKSDFLEKEKIGYVRLTQFMGKEHTLEEFRKTIAGFMAKKPKGLIIDLRMNPGGLLDMAVDISNLFLPSGEDIVSVRGRGGELIKVFKSKSLEQSWTSVPMIVMVNEGSASASEIFSGAMQDHKRAKILGTTSFGKGSVQNIYRLSHDTALKLTIQKYFTPSGKSIHGKGIQPDIVVEPIRPNEDDRFYLKKLRNSDVFDKFMKSHSNYSQKNYLAFMQFLKAQDLTLRPDVAKLFYKSKATEGKERPLVDLEIDSQLKKAVETLQ